MSRSPLGPAAEQADEEDALRVAACARLVQRTGAKEFDVGYLNRDAVRSEDAQWYATAVWQGVKLFSAGEHRSPGAAADALAARLLDGGQCCCGRVATTDPRGAPGGDKTMLHGEDWSHAEQLAAGVCVWSRRGDQWERGCDARPIRLTPEQVRRLRG